VTIFFCYTHLLQKKKLHALQHTLQQCSSAAQTPSAAGLSAKSQLPANGQQEPATKSQPRAVSHTELPNGPQLATEMGSEEAGHRGLSTKSWQREPAIKSQAHGAGHRELAMDSLPRTEPGREVECRLRVAGQRELASRTVHGEATNHRERATESGRKQWPQRASHNAQSVCG
jgi:hypothetical protein